MQIINRIDDLRKALSSAREINFVPTMGNLHAGHLSLVNLARQRAGVAVASIFVNPLQFAANEDYGTYPRTLDSDCSLLEKGGCDIVFAPTAAEMYPEPQAFYVQPPAAIGDLLEGRSRPGFFVGVSTVVLKLFNIVRPTVAVFGKKDYQQLLVVRGLVSQFALPIEIVAGETAREAGGLALSSRNGYLTDAEREEAAHLFSSLKTVAEQVRSGRHDWLKLEQTAMDGLRARRWSPDYVSIRQRENLADPSESKPLVVLAAAQLGTTRLIDSLEI